MGTGGFRAVHQLRVKQALSRLEQSTFDSNVERVSHSFLRSGLPAACKSSIAQIHANPSIFASMWDICGSIINSLPMKKITQKERPGIAFHDSRPLRC
ncbi:MAG: hypothetical protein AUF65_00610 [Chloroflexi bacterium 13_1_20CM_50_12]|nr:MAG: hypothetical protein AUF65_00610 [Chloroflexi bacterium 13_1_20CM_50_12]